LITEEEGLLNVVSETLTIAKLRLMSLKILMNFGSDNRFGNVIFFTPMLVANVVHIMETKKGDEGERAGRVLVDVTRHAENTLGTWS